MTIQYDDFMTHDRKPVRCKVMACPVRIEGRTVNGWMTIWPGKVQFGCKTFTRAYDRFKYWLFQVQHQTEKAKELGLTAIRVYVSDSVIAEHEWQK